MHRGGLLVFYLLSAFLFRGESLLEIGCATVLARVASAAAIFCSTAASCFAAGRWLGFALCHFILCTIAVSAAAVYGGVYLFHWLGGGSFQPEAVKTALKAVVDTLLFFANYHLCKSGCFKRPARKRSRDRGARRPAAGLSAQALRKADGVMPTALLNTVAKYVGEAKPQAAAIPRCFALWRRAACARAECAAVSRIRQRCSQQAFENLAQVTLAEKHGGAHALQRKVLRQVRANVAQAFSMCGRLARLWRSPAA